MSEKYIFYGVSRSAEGILNSNKKTSPYVNLPTIKNGLCFVDKDIRKIGSSFLGLQILSLQDALNQYPKAEIYLTIKNANVITSVITDLEEYGIGRDSIINLKYNKMLSCPYIEDFIVCGYHEGAFGGFAGTDCGRHSLKSCCSDYGKNNVEIVEIADSLESSFNRFLELREESFKNLLAGDSCKCTGCMQLRNNANYFLPKHFSYAIFNELGKCNIKCSYCNYLARIGRNVSDDIDFMQFFDLVKMYGFDKENGIVELCNGEITVHPQKQQIYDYLDDYTVMFITNGLIFDEEIHKKMTTERGIINVSIDSGSASTFKRVKGVDGYERVVGNLEKYNQNRKGIMNLKYILLPGINDEITDLDNFIDLCSDLTVSSAHISCNLNLQYKDYNNEKTKFSINYLIDKLRAHSIPFEIYSSMLKNLADIAI